MTTQSVEPSTGTIRPLDGLRILEVGGGVAASYTTKILGAFGAEIIKIEEPSHGDSVRHLGPFVGGAEDPEKGIPFLDLNLGKLSITLDLASAEGKAIFEDLCSTSAALVISMSPPARSRLGIDLVDLGARHPDLVVCSVTSFGEDGPYRDRPASEIVIYGMGHAMHGTGTIDRGPTAIAPYLSLTYAGYNAAVPLAAALLRRRHDGTGEHIDFSIFESFAAAMDRRAQSIMAYEYSGEPLLRPTGDAPEGRYTRCKDGFVAVAMAGNAWTAALEMMGVDDADRERLTPPWSDEKDHLELLDRWAKFALTQGRYELSTELQRRGIAAGPVNSVRDLLTDEHLAVREVFKSVHHPKVGEHTIVALPIRMKDTPGRYDTPAPLLGEHTDAVLGSLAHREPRVSAVRDRGVLQELPLAGYRVIDFGVVLAGPFGSMQLADLGADVIRVESTQFFVPTTRGIVARRREMALSQPAVSGGYPGREPGTRPWNRFPWFNVSNRNKRGMTVDLLKPEGAEPFRRLVEISDVIINNQTLRASKAQGIDYETVRKINPRIVYVSASLFGDGGPLSNFKGGGPQMEAFSGSDDLRRYRDGDVTLNSWAVPSDAAGGVGNALGAILGLHARETTGKGQYIDLSLVENELALLGPNILEAAITGQSPPILGNRSRCAVQGAYQTDGDDHWLTLTVPDANGWRGLVQLIGRPEWADQPYDNAQWADARHDEIDVAISNWTKTMDRDVAVDTLLAAGVWAGPTLPENEIVVDQQHVARNYFMVLDHAEAGRHRYPGPPYRLRESKPFPTMPSVRLGEHNDELYSQLLGFSDSEIEKLRELGHIGEDYAANVG